MTTGERAHALVKIYDDRHPARRAAAIHWSNRVADSQGSPAAIAAPIVG
jgi:hypothetical protein